MLARMSHWLTLSRAAHLLGIPRTDLQDRIRNGDLASHDGMIAEAELLRVWPGAETVTSGAFEKVVAIRDDAFAKRLRERVLPTQEVLAQRLFAQGQELAELRRVLTRYHAVMEGLRARLDGDAPPSTAEMAALLDEGMAAAFAAPAPLGDMDAVDATLRVMSAHVSVRPSGRDYYVDGAETLLKAALRAGLAPNYGCGNGNCGLCKARVISGTTQQVAASDYRFTEAEKAQGHVLMCACTAVSSDLVLEVLEAGAPEEIPEQRIVARVRSVEAVGENVLRLHLQTPRSNRLRFLAGQRVTLGSTAGSAAGTHGEYPIASCPCDDRNLIFHIHRDGRRATSADFSTHLFAGDIKAGDDISVWGPWGNFVLDNASQRPLIFVAIDTGFAPVSSLIEHAIAVDAAPAIRLYRAGDIYLANQCRAWADALDDFRYIPLAPDQLADTLVAEPLLAASEVYLAGPADALAALAATLVAAGLPTAQLHTEAL